MSIALNCLARMIERGQVRNGLDREFAVNRRTAARAGKNLALAGLALVIGTGCRGESPRPEGDGAATGGTVIVAVPTDIVSLYPPEIEYALDFAVANSVFDKLADVGDDLNTIGEGGVKAQLAERWDWASDSLSIAFHIDPKARWHDGQPVRAEDVRFTFRAYTEVRERGPNADYMSNIDSVSVADSMTAVVWFKRRMPQQFFQATYHMYIMPAHILQKVPLDSLAKSALVQSPVGSGRFRFVQRTLKERIEIVADTGNYRTRAKLDRVIFSISDGVASATLKLFSGDADFFEKLGTDELPGVAKAPSLRVQPFPQIGYGYMSFNLFDRKNRQVPHPLFGDVRVRRALSMAVDRVAAARQVLDTFGLAAVGPTPRALLPNWEKLKQLEFDRAHARALLDSAGWLVPPGGGVRMKDGVPLRFEIVVANTSIPRQTYARTLEGLFRGVEAEAKMRPLEGRVLGAEMEVSNFDAYIGGLSLTPGLQGMPQSWGTRGIGGRNAGGYQNRVFDATVDSALSSFNATQANDRWLRAIQQILDDAPAIWLYEDVAIGVIHKRIQLPPMRADGWYAHLADWSVDPKQQIARDRQGLKGAR